ncbi:MAG TPA: DUF1648 domain-containing protein [Oscillatoriales cyanobacterium M59_W2019_021]|nr:MAG: DUF1648 domain-containing protein [Cyanobacteria bacterium J055]HIK33933.1 DUF1648 domain-containing protein [Oscillatoriales cyanobacterium M4454_W2019_049]HIK51640.1 DUF1648 domain-containing protein [Oscillatoriales cyanobacterium M59_W2019_021]
MPRKAEIGAIALVVFAFAIGFAVYPQLPENYASHWNFAGEIDGYLPKSWGLFLIPAVMGVWVAILSLVPRFDRFPDNVRSFRSYYDGLIILICLFLLAINLQSILWNLGLQITPNTTFPILFGILWFYLGIQGGDRHRYYLAQTATIVEGVPRRRTRSRCRNALALRTAKGGWGVDSRSATTRSQTRH